MDGLTVPHDDDGHGADLESAKVLQMQRSALQPGSNVIQTVDGQLIQMGSDGDAGSVLNPQEDEESRKRRELLARRPSYRKIFNELSEHGGGQMGAVPKMEDNDDSNDSLMSNDDDLPVGAGGGMLTSHSSVGAGGGMQTLTMTNAASTAAQVANNSTGATIVQYAQGADGQFFIPGNISYQIAPGNPVAQGVVMAGGGGEEQSRKRELRLLKNREAARECRRKKKEYIKCLENRVALLENQNKTLIEELKSLKELYCQKEQS